MLSWRRGKEEIPWKVQLNTAAYSWWIRLGIKLQSYVTAPAESAATMQLCHSTHCSPQDPSSKTQIKLIPGGLSIPLWMLSEMHVLKWLC